jgi:hypothetical protein
MVCVRLSPLIASESGVISVTSFELIKVMFLLVGIVLQAISLVVS